MKKTSYEELKALEHGAIFWAYTGVTFGFVPFVFCCVNPTSDSIIVLEEKANHSLLTTVSKAAHCSSIFYVGKYDKNFLKQETWRLADLAFKKMEETKNQL